MFCAAAVTLHPPYEQQVLYYFVLQPVLSRGMAEKLQRVEHLVGLIFGGTASAESQAEAITQRIPGRLGELDGPQAMPVQVSIRVYDCLVGHGGHGDATCPALALGTWHGRASEKSGAGAHSRPRCTNLARSCSLFPYLSPLNASACAFASIGACRYKARIAGPLHTFVTASFIVSAANPAVSGSVHTGTQS